MLLKTINTNQMPKVLLHFNNTFKKQKIGEFRDVTCLVIVISIDRACWYYTID